MMRARRTGEEVFVADDGIVQLRASDLEGLMVESRSTARGRMRFCAHHEISDRLHEMFVVHPVGAYVRPHKHLGKSESLHVLTGEADAVFFDEDGDVTAIVPLGPYGSGRCFYYRIDEAVHHTLLIRSPLFVFHEVTNGPFARADTVFAPWAPEDSDTAVCAAFLTELDSRVAR